MKNKHFTLLAILLSCAIGSFAQCVIQITDEQPYLEDFDSGTMECWTVEATGAGTWSVMTGTVSNVAAFQNASADDEARLISPTFDLSGVSGATFSFSYAMMALFNNDVLTASYRSAETDTWHELGSYSINDWQNTYEATFDLPDLSSTYQISFLAHSNGGYYIFIDNVEIVGAGGCARPVNLEATDITSNSALLGWTTTGNETQWTVELDGHPQTVNVQPFLMEGLMPQSEYTFRVKADCGDGLESEWSYPATFKTLCDVITVTDDEPFFDDFEGSDDFVCWENRIVSGDYGWAIDPGYLILNNTAYFFWMSGEAMLVSAPLDISAVTHPTLQFLHKQPLADDADHLYIGYRISTEDEWHTIGSYEYPSNEWESENIPLPNVSTTLQIGFAGVASNGYGNGIYVDDVRVGNYIDDGVDETLVPVATVSPNPASEKAVILTNVADGEVDVYDVAGRKVAATLLREGRAELDLSGVAQGVYTARVSGKSGVAIVKIVKE